MFSLKTKSHNTFTESVETRVLVTIYFPIADIIIIIIIISIIIDASP